MKGTGSYGLAGCGLGSLVFESQPGFVQVLAATTNGTSWNNTFGMTSGTSNCGPSIFAQGTRNFVDANREVLAKDVVADDAWKGAVNFYVKGVEGKVPAGK